MDIVHIRNKYRDRMLMLAFIASGWSDQPEGKKHGAVLAIDGKYPVALSFNGPDRFARDYAPRIVHAEENGLINARLIGVDVSKCIAFVSKKPCPDCQQQLEEAGIKAIFWLQDVGEDRGQWTL